MVGSEAGDEGEGGVTWDKILSVGNVQAGNFSSSERCDGWGVLCLGMGFIPLSGSFCAENMAGLACPSQLLCT